MKNVILKYTNYIYILKEEEDTDGTNQRRNKVCGAFCCYFIYVVGAWHAVEDLVAVNEKSRGVLIIYSLI